MHNIPFLSLYILFIFSYIISFFFSLFYSLSSVIVVFIHERRVHSNLSKMKFGAVCVCFFFSRSMSKSNFVFCLSGCAVFDISVSLEFFFVWIHFHINAYEAMYRINEKNIKVVRRTLHTTIFHINLSLCQTQTHTEKKNRTNLEKYIIYGE